MFVCLFIFSLFVYFSALTVRFLTRRFIGEYDQTLGEYSFFKLPYSSSSLPQDKFPRIEYNDPKNISVLEPFPNLLQFKLMKICRQNCLYSTTEKRKQTISGLLSLRIIDRILCFDEFLTAGNCMLCRM